MSAPGRPPETYQQWLDCLRYLQKHPWDGEACRLVQQGTIASAPESFKARISDTTSAMLSSHCRRFLRQMDQAPSEGDGDMVPLLAQRFWRNIPMCLFYRQLTFLEPDFVRLLEEGYEKQLRSFWRDLLRQISRDARDSDDPVMEELEREMKRIKTL